MPSCPPEGTATCCWGHWLSPSNAPAPPVAPERIHPGCLRSWANRAAAATGSRQLASPFFKHPPGDLGAQSIINWEGEASACGFSSSTCTYMQAGEKTPFPLQLTPAGLLLAQQAFAAGERRFPPGSSRSSSPARQALACNHHLQRCTQQAEGEEGEK